MLKMQPEPDVLIVIVNWNTKELLEQCLNSIFSVHDSLTIGVVVVDNGSTDESIKMLKLKFPQVTLIENKQNVGFARANNQAFRLAKKGGFVLMLNSDAVLTDGTLQELFDFMESDPNVGAVAPALCFPDGEAQSGGGYMPSLITAFNYFLFLSSLSPFVFKGMFVDQNDYKRSRIPREIDWIAGACMLIRQETLEQVGGLDESYFMYAEDAEWCQRIRTKGWAVYYLPYLEIIHHHGASSTDVSNQWIKSLIAYMKSKNGFLQSLIFRGLIALGMGLRSLFYLSAFFVTQNKECRTKAARMFNFFLGAFN